MEPRVVRTREILVSGGILTVQSHITDEQAEQVRTAFNKIVNGPAQLVKLIPLDQRN